MAVRAYNKKARCLHRRLFGSDEPTSTPSDALCNTVNQVGDAGRHRPRLNIVSFGNRDTNFLNTQVFSTGATAYW